VPRVVAELLKSTSDWLAGRGVGAPRLDAELLLGQVLGLERLQLYTSFDRPLAREELDAFRELVRRRGGYEPVAYILGRKEFYSRDFAVDRRVLVPRPDTEVLVDLALERLAPEVEGVALDYGTGSGAIAVTLACERTGLKVLALDLSREALDVARTNAATHGVADRVGFVRSDGLAALPVRFEGQLAAIVANPPYVPLEDKPGLPPDVRDHEPELALFAGPDPLIHYRRLALDGLRWLAPDGFVAVEVGAGQADDVVALFDEAGWGCTSVRNDLARIARVVVASS
jgi:release factor glutamine methyltransferase